MKRYRLLLALLLLASFASAQDKGKETNSLITEVTVFLRGAQVTRFAQPTLEKGDNELVLRGLATGIDPNSIQVSAPEDVLINSVVHEANYLNQFNQSKRAALLLDSLQLVRDLLSQNALSQSLLQQEKQMLQQNQRLAGEQVGVDVAELEKAANFLRARLRDIDDRLFDLTKKQRDLAKREQRLSLQYNELNGMANLPSNDIRIKLTANAPKRVDLTVRYVVGGALWVPGYDIRAKDTQSPIRIDYRADVFQKTGEDWKDVRLTLSTGNPSAGGTQPTLSQWNLYAYNPHDYDRRRSMLKVQSNRTSAAGAYDETKSEDSEAYVTKEEVSFEDATTLAEYTKVEVGNTMAEFVIGIPQTVASGDKPQQVSIQSTELPADYRHYAVPKLDKDAFLTAGITGWEKLNLLPGNAQIFFEGTYVTEAFIDPALTEDTLSISLGRDPKVVIQRDLLKDHNKARMIGFNREKTFGYEFKIRNTKNAPVRLTLKDQIPVSQDKDIVVKVEEISGAKQDPVTGELTWELVLQPNETKTFRLIYSVKHPKNKTVPGI